MTKMKSIIYPVVFEEENGQYNITIPDFNNAMTWGKDLEEAIYMARDLMGALVIDKEINNLKLPKRTSISNIKLKNQKSFITLIDLDIEKYKKSLIKSVKKTVYISSELNERAEELGLNFSQILRNALKAEIDKY